MFLNLSNFVDRGLVFKWFFADIIERFTFSADDLPDLPVGWLRSFILFSDGWVKDADINTLASQTVGPLPFHQMSDYPPPEDSPAELRAYNLEYNTRRVKHVLPPLEE